MKTPISYYGGKQNLLKYILPLIPAHTLYTEAFAGGCAVLFAKDPAKCEVINDINKGLINFYLIAKKHYNLLKLEIDATLHCRAQHDHALYINANPEWFSPAQRFSDYSIISSSDIHDDIIRIRQHKSSGVVKVVEVPVHPIVKQILARNKGEFPPAPSVQSFNATIKRICKKAGIDKKILIERTEGNKIIKKYIKKYELVGSHTARRSGAALLVYAEPAIRIERILLITGHDCVTTLLDYIRASKEENARGLLQHRFFSQYDNI